MSKTKARYSSRSLSAVELQGELGVNIDSPMTSAPSQDWNRKQFECPLCVDVFTEFHQLKWHLMSMHPRREMIMKLVTERYGISERCAETQPSAALDSQNVEEVQRAGKQQPVLVGRVATTPTFQVPLKLRQKVAAFPQTSNDQCEMRYEGFACAQKIKPSGESSPWESYL